VKFSVTGRTIWLGCTIKGLDAPTGLRAVRLQEFLESRRMYVIRLSALLTDRHYPPPLLTRINLWHSLLMEA